MLNLSYHHLNLIKLIVFLPFLKPKYWQFNYNLTMRALQVIILIRPMNIIYSCMLPKSNNSYIWTITLTIVCSPQVQNSFTNTVIFATKHLQTLLHWYGICEKKQGRLCVRRWIGNLFGKIVGSSRTNTSFILSKLLKPKKRPK